MLGPPADLTMHHTIEERHIFPVLAKRMPAFQNDEVHLRSHHGIHEGLGSVWYMFAHLRLCLLAVFLIGLDKLAELLQKWNADPSTYSPTEMKECLDSWREVLFKHLDEEVSTGCFD